MALTSTPSPGQPAAPPPLKTPTQPCLPPSLCSVGGVQSQSITVDRQMRRYDVPRVAFINKLDRAGADPWKVQRQMREKLRLNVAAVQVCRGEGADVFGILIPIFRSVVLFGALGWSGCVESAVPDAEEAGSTRRRCSCRGNCFHCLVSFLGGGTWRLFKHVGGRTWGGLFWGCGGGRLRRRLRAACALRHVALWRQAGRVTRQDIDSARHVIPCV